MQRIVASALLVSIFLFVYGEVWRFDYVWDDVALFLNNVNLRQAREFGDVWAAVSTPILPGTTYFRPLVLLTFWFEFQFTGGDPAASHVVNVVIHAVNVLLVGSLAASIWRQSHVGRAWIVTIAMMTYAVNPALHEAVCWVSGRFDLLATTFTLLACRLALCRRLDSVMRGALCGAAFLGGLLSKEVSICTPIMVLMVMAASDVQKFGCDIDRNVFWLNFIKRNSTTFIALAIALVLYVWLRVESMPSLLHENPSLATMAVFERAALVGRTVAFYAVKLFFPFISLGPQHPYDVGDLGWWDVFVLAGFVIVVAGLMIQAYRLNSHSMLMVACISGVAPVLNIIPLTIGSNIGHDRFLTLPLAALSLLLMPLSEAIWKRLGVAGFTTAGALLILLFTANLKVTVPLWRNELTLWTWAYTQYPSSVFIQHSYVTAALKWNDLEKARSVIEKSGRIATSDAMLFLEVELLVKEGRHEAALQLANKVMALRPRMHLRYKNRSQVPDEVLRQMVLQDWHLPAALRSIAQSNIALKQFKDAEAAAQHALFYSPQLPAAQLLYAYALWGQGRELEGDAAYKIAYDSYALPTRPEVSELTRSYLRQLCEGTNNLFACQSKWLR